MNLKEWRRSKGWNQGEIAAKLRIAQNTYSAWETGRSEIPADGERDLRKLGFTGLLPRQEATAPAGGGYVTREEYGELVGRLKRLEEDYRALLPLAVAVKDLDARVQKVEGGRGSGE